MTYALTELLSCNPQIVEFVSQSIQAQKSFSESQKIINNSLEQRIYKIEEFMAQFQHSKSFLLPILRAVEEGTTFEQQINHLKAQLKEKEVEIANLTDRVEELSKSVFLFLNLQPSKLPFPIV